MAKFVVEHHTVACDQTCGICSRNWFDWLKAREGQMSVPQKDKVRADGSVRVGCSVPFTEAARTSLVPWPAAGEDVMVFWNTGRAACVGVVTYHAGVVGEDGRWWVQVQVPGEKPVHVERGNLRRVR